MSVNSYEQQILKAVDILTDGAIKDLKFDKSILATVESIEDITTGEHKVRFQDGVFSAFSSSPGLYYTPGSLVYVQIPQGDFSERKIILSGKTTLPNNELAEYVNDFIDNKYPEDAKAWIQSWWTPSDEDPADSWTDALALHEGDFWYQTDTNNYFRYTLVEGGTYQWEMIQGINAVTGLLTNENHTVTAEADGTGYSLTTAGGSFKVYSGTTDVTEITVFSGTATKSGLTLTIDSTGVYTLSGDSWTSDSESFILTAVYDGVIITKFYTITKSKAGEIGTPASIYEVELDPPNIRKSRDGILTPSFLTIKSYKITGNATREPYAGRFKIYENGSSTATYSSEIDQNSYTYTPSVTANHIKVELWAAGGFVTLLDTQSTVITNDSTGGNLLYTNEWIVDPDTEITSSSFEHWSPIVNMDGDGLLNNVILNTNGPYETSVPVWRMTVQQVSDWVSASSADFLIDNTQKYRFTIWFKKVGTHLEDGSIYLGTKSEGVLSLTDISGITETWSYFTETDSSALNEWHLLVAHIHPYTNEIVYLDPASGIYNIKGEKTNLEVTDFKWPADQLNSSFRFGYGYNTIQQEVYFYAPRVDLCDGNELPLHAFFPVLNLIENANAYFKTSFQLLNDDGVISAIEKRTLYEFWNTLMMDVSLLLSKANSTQFENINSDDFNSAYSSLKNYILGTENTYLPGLHLFQDFTSDTSLCLYVFRSGNYQEVLEALEDDTEIISALDYWDLKWNTFYNEKSELELAIRAEELSQYNSQTSLLNSLTEFQVNADGTLTSINNVLEFTTEGLVVRVDGLSLKIIISNEKISFMNESGAEVAYITKDEMSIASLKAVNKLQLGIHTIEKLTPASHPTQTVIR